MKKLSVFSPYELRLMLCGEQSPSWTRDDVLRFTEPKYGYTKDRLAMIKQQQTLAFTIITPYTCIKV